MKRLFTIFIIFIFPLLLTANDETHKVVVLKDWKPYYFINDTGKPDGYAVELFEKLAKIIDLKYEYVIVNDGKEAIKFIEEKKADLIPNIGLTKKREKVLIFTQTTDSFYINLYRKNDSNYNSIEDLENKNIGLVQHNACTKIIDDKEIKINKIYFKDYKEMIQALMAKKIDAFCYPQPLVASDLKNNSIVAFDKSIKEIKRGIGLSKDHFHLLSKFNDAITEIKLNGELQIIYDKWFREKDFIRLSMKETLFLTILFIGLSSSILIIVFYILSKKRWLLTKDMLEEEIERKTNILKVQNRRLKVIHKKLKEQSNRDALTKVYNRKFYNQKIRELLSSYKRYGNIFSFIMFDIDDFKKINDTYGHSIGDKVLIELSKIVSFHIRFNDFFFRVGGEEFIILLPDTDIKEAKIVANKIKDVIAQEINIVEIHKVTVSIGLTEVRDKDDEDIIYNRTDNNLYKAKNTGKNRVVF